MGKNTKIRLLFLLLTAIYIFALYSFYIKYVPLVKSFQAILIPVLSVLIILTALRIQWGTLFFVLCFPLINGLPYFFGIFEHIPHAPTALVLFLFYFLGWLVHNCLKESTISFEHPVFKPMILFSLFIILSGLITSLRFANFYPFLSDSIYELITNVNGVTAGGALMSTLFHSLNYLTGFAFFFILFNTIKSEKHVKKILFTLMISVSVSLIFGFYQQFKDMSFGNTPFWVGMKQINSTLKDPNSFGVFLAAVIPFVLGMAFVFKGLLRICFGIVFILILLIFPHIGTRSGFLGLIISLFTFLVLSILSSKNMNRKLFTKKTLLGVAFALIAIILTTGILSISNSRLFDRLKGNTKILVEKGFLMGVSPERFFLWKEAVGMLKSYPLSGVGVGAYIIELPNYYQIDQESYELELESFRRIDSAENYFLHVGAELGIIVLVFILWLFWMIFRQMKKSLRSYKDRTDDKNKFILIGVMAGITSYLVNLLFHSYIGSYEIKYAFWLFVALAFYLDKSEKETGEELRFRKGLKFLCITLIVLVCGVHLWNSTHSLSLKTRTAQFDLKQDFGLYQSEKTNDGKEFRWTRGYGGLTRRIEKPVLEIPLLASHPDIRKNPVKVKIYLIKDFFKQKKLLDEITLSENIWKTYEYHIPEELNQEVILLVKVSRTWNPLKTLGTPDPRNLGVAIGKIHLKDKI